MLEKDLGIIMRYSKQIIQPCLQKRRSIEAEKSTSTATHAVTMKSVSTMEAGTMNQTDELTRQMNELITIVKNQ